MTTCPSCGTENIEGVDHCERCGHSLVDLSLPTPATSVERSLLNDRVSVLRPKKPLVVPPREPVSKVLAKLVEKSIGCVVIVDNNQVVGVFSERDALMRLGADATKLGSRPVSEFMTPNPQTLQDTAKIAFAVHRMDLGGYRHIPIVDAEGHPTGVISVRDILRYLTEQISAAVPA